MARRTSKCVKIGHEEPMARWLDDVGIDIEDMESISSDEELESSGENDRRINLPLQEIWDANVTVETLPDYEKCAELLKCDNLEEILLKYKQNLRTAVLTAAAMENCKALEFLLENGAYVQAKDDYGRTALHLATSVGCEKCVQSLLQHGANVDCWDRMKRVTPLHCAANVGNLECVKLLIKYGAEINAGLDTRSSLHYAVQRDAVDCVRELLEAGANPNNAKVYSETPLHVAASIGSPGCIKLLIEHGASLMMQCGEDKSTALHLAVQGCSVETVQLLLDAGADITATNYKGQTPLHMAAFAQAAETLELLLQRGAKPNISDMDGRTPLHSAIVKVSRSCECVRLLLNAHANVNKADAFGYTPLHLAALNEFSHCVQLLLNHGGNVTAKTNGGQSALAFIIRRTPDVLPKYLAKFDAAITLNEQEIGDVDCELNLDFRVLVPSVGRGETGLLLNFIEVGQRKVLKHPLCETFLFLKWKRIRKFFWFSLFYHSLFVFLFSFYILGIYLKDCPFVRRMAEPCLVPNYILAIGYFLVCLNVLLVAKELFQIAHSWIVYVKNWENWLQWSIIISVFLCVIPTSDNRDIQQRIDTWQHHVAAIGILLTWLELMMIVGRFPVFGLYIQMFTTVAINFSKFLAAYLCLLIAFSLSFGVLFANTDQYKNNVWGILKTVVMMSGELEFDDMFYGDKQIIYPVTTHVIYLAFVVLVTIILANLMVGLAVSDIQGLQRSAGLNRLIRQAELVAHLESMLFSRLLHFLPKKVLAFLHGQALLLTSRCHWNLHIRPNDPREDRIPRNLINNIYQLVVEHKERHKRSRSRKKCAKNIDKVKSNIKSTVKPTTIKEINTEHQYYSNVHSIKQQIAELKLEILNSNQELLNKIDQLNSDAAIILS